MTATDTEAMSALHALLDERQRYQAWLTTLEGRRSSTPPHVYERVQQDYASRLDRVMQSLAERAGQLRGTIEGLTAQLSALRQHESDRMDERHEAELRAAVGEFTPEDWERRRQEADADLERIATERRALAEELDELQRIVALTRSIRTEATTVAERATEGSAGMAGSGTATSVAEDTAQTIEEFVAEWHPPQVRQGSSDGRVTTSTGEVLDPADLGDEVIPRAPIGGNPIGAAGADYGIANGVTGVPGGVTPVRTPPPAPAAMGDSRRDTDKTLKCPECGAMNYATEWYCERCGGELSTF